MPRRSQSLVWKTGRDADMGALLDHIGGLNIPYTLLLAPYRRRKTGLGCPE